MKVQTKILLFLFLIYQGVHANVILENVNVETELYGVLGKTRVECMLRNTSERDNVAGGIYLDVNRTAIVSDMWLEIDGELHRAETLSAESGQAIYRRINRKRIDPAVMLKIDDGRYCIDIFPFSAGQTRRVVVEYYSVLENDRFSLYCWNWDSKSTCINLNITGTSPVGTELSVMDGAFMDFKEPMNYKLANTDTVKISLKFPDVFSHYAIYNYSSSLTFNKRYDSYHDFTFQERDDIVAGIDSLLHEIRDRKKVFVTNLTNNAFLTSFLEYLAKQGYLAFNQHFELWRWFRENDHWAYRDNLFTLTEGEQPVYDGTGIYCPFTHVFTEYNNIVNETIKVQKEHGFLLRGLSKLVIEDDARAVSIREQQMERETEIEKTYYDRDEEIKSGNRWGDIFVAFDSPPIPEGGFSAIQRQLIYPDYFIAKGIEGRVMIRLLVSEQGLVVKTCILQSIHPVLDYLAIRAVNQVKWKPAEQRGKPIRTWIAIPVVYRLDTDKQKAKSNWASYMYDFSYGDKVFTVSIFDDQIYHIEKTFRMGDFTIIQYLSDGFFQLLLDHPEFIDYAYEFFNENTAQNVGFVVDGQSVMIMRDISKKVVK